MQGLGCAWVRIPLACARPDVRRFTHPPPSPQPRTCTMAVRSKLAVPPPSAALKSMPAISSYLQAHQLAYTWSSRAVGYDCTRRAVCTADEACSAVGGKGRRLLGANAQPRPRVAPAVDGLELGGRVVRARVGVCGKQWITIPKGFKGGKGGAGVFMVCVLETKLLFAAGGLAG